MDKTLIQRDFIKTTQVTIVENGIQVDEKNLNNSYEYFIPFENIPSETFSTRSFRKWAVILTMFFGVFSTIAAWAQTTPQSTISQPRGIITVITLAHYWLSGVGSSCTIRSPILKV